LMARSDTINSAASLPKLKPRPHLKRVADVVRYSLRVLRGKKPKIDLTEAEVQGVYFLWELEAVKE
jgi:hypothetical protein